MKEGSLVLKEFLLKYSVFGEGDNAILAFHGFNQSRTQVEFLSQNENLKQFRLISVGLFHHESVVSGEVLKERPISTEEFGQLIRSLCEKESFHNFSLLGYSIGCRLCLELIVQMPDRVNNAVLIAPDGISRNKWYFFLMNSFVGKNIFQFALKRIDIVRNLNELFFKIGLTSSFERKVAAKALEKKENIELVWRTWSTYKKIYPAKESWTASLNEFEIPSCFIFGKYDKLIPAEISQELIKLNNQFCKVMLLDSGHDLLNNKHSDLISQCLNSFSL